MQACRTALCEVNRNTGGHAGLLLQRYLRIAVGSDTHPEERGALLAAARKATKAAASIYRWAFERWHTSLLAEANATSVSQRGQVTKTLDLAVDGRLAIGLGNASPLEVGITLHHTYGVPLLPGSSLKGLTAHWCADAWGQADPKFGLDGEHYRILFGTSEDAGQLVFHDAWLLPDCLWSETEGLVVDVTTPHHADYYSGSRAPTDFDDPTPITFLGMAGRFRVAVSCHGEGDAEQWAKLALALLREALEHRGIGGKTSSGYGRMIDSAAHASRAATARVPTPPRSERITAAKRPSGTPARVRILKERPKGGYGVQEEGRPEGTLTLGTPPSPPPQIGDSVDVVVKDDDPRRPQYQWQDPHAKGAAAHSRPRGPDRRRGRP